VPVHVGGIVYTKISASPLRNDMVFQHSSMGFDMKTLVDLEPTLVHLGSSAKNAANWIERLNHLSKAMLPTLPGQSRLFPKMQAKQLILVAAFVRSGARPSEADESAASFAKEAEQGVELPEFLLVQSGDFGSWSAMDSSELEGFRKYFPTVPITIIPLRAIARLVDDVYASESR
jgi:hypothetical protein